MKPFGERLSDSFLSYFQTTHNLMRVRDQVRGEWWTEPGQIGYRQTPVQQRIISALAGVDRSIQSIRNGLP